MDKPDNASKKNPDQTGLTSAEKGSHSSLLRDASRIKESIRHSLRFAPSALVFVDDSGSTLNEY